LDIAGSFQWNGSFQGNGIQEAASRLMIRVQDSQDIFLNTSFGGFIVAPNAHVIVGQAEKNYAGQIYAKSITVHQNVQFQWVRPGETFMNIATSSREVIYARSND
jgi:choice-of-anchor A domain-containing protein